MTKRIIFIANSPIIGGAERHTVHLAAGLARYGYQSQIFFLKDIGQRTLKAAPGVGFDIPPPQRGFRDRVSDLRAQIQQQGCDLLVAVNERPSIATFLARTGLGQKRPRAAAIIHSTKQRNVKALSLWMAHFPIFASFDAMIFISERQREYWRRRGLWTRRHRVILNGIDTGLFAPVTDTEKLSALRAALKFADRDYVIAVSALLRPEKNHAQLLRAVAELRRLGLPAKVLMIGDGPMRGEIEAEIAKLNLQAHVTITGVVDDVRPYLAAADVGVLCSNVSETLSLAALETMAMGLPMIMSDLGGASEIIDPQCGRLFTVNDDKGLTEALLRYAEPQFRAAQAEAARAKIVNNFDEHHMVQSYAAYFDLVLAGGRPQGA